MPSAHIALVEYLNTCLKYANNQLIHNRSEIVWSNDYMGYEQ